MNKQAKYPPKREARIRYRLLCIEDRRQLRNQVRILEDGRDETDLEYQAIAKNRADIDEEAKFLQKVIKG